METILEEQKEAIRLYWSNYYNYNESLEILHRKLSSLPHKVVDAEQHNEYISSMSREELEKYLSKKQDFYTNALKLLKKTQFQIDEIESIMSLEQQQFERLLSALQLKMEERSYDESLYNLVNGLEDELYIKK